jgi:hypothetical protein
MIRHLRALFARNIASDLYERCSAITRIIKAQAFLVNDPNDFYRDVDEALRQVRIEMGIDPPPSTSEP